MPPIILLSPRERKGGRGKRGKKGPGENQRGKPKIQKFSFPPPPSKKRKDTKLGRGSARPQPNQGKPTNTRTPNLFNNTQTKTRGFFGQGTSGKRKQSKTPTYLTPRERENLGKGKKKEKRRTNKSLITTPKSRRPKFERLRS